MVKHKLFDGTKAISVDQLPEEAWRVVLGNDKSEDASSIFNVVPFLYRCIDIRAKAVSKMPFQLLRGDTELDYRQMDVTKNLSKLLYQTEVSLCLYAYAYWFKERNLVKTLSARWLAPKSIRPEFDGNQGLKRFYRSVGSESKLLEIEDVVYFWLPPLNSEVGYGIAPAAVALNSAGVLGSNDLFLKNFFERGAVFPMLLTVEGNPQRHELDKLEAWWRRLLRGVQTAWETIAVKASVKPEIIGPPISEMAMGELTATQRENIATALGVPYSLVLSNAANYATAHQDSLNFYDFTIVPECALIEEVVNEQLLEPMGLRLSFQPKQLEVYQTQNLQQATEVIALVQAGIINENDAREIAGYEPIEDEAEEADTLGGFEQMSTRQLHLEQWQRKATNRLKSAGSAVCKFESAVISDVERHKIMSALDVCFTEAEIKALFSEIKMSLCPH